MEGHTLTLWLSVQIFRFGMSLKTQKDLSVFCGLSLSPTTDLNCSCLHIVRSFFSTYVSQLGIELSWMRRYGTQHFTREQSKSETANSSFQVHPAHPWRCCGASSLRSLVENEVSQVKDINEVSPVLALPTWELTLEGRRAGLAFLFFCSIALPSVSSTSVGSRSFCVAKSSSLKLKTRKPTNAREMLRSQDKC